MEIKIAKQAGYCYGVERALRMTSAAAREKRKKPIYTLGPIIHNPQVVASFAEQGVEPINSIDDIDAGTVIVRTHGVAPDIIKKAKEKGLGIVDVTCPFVAKAQQRAAELVESGYGLLIVGEKEHPEVVGILGHAKGKAVVIEKAEDAVKMRLKRRLGVVVQTTQLLGDFQQIVSVLTAKTAELKVFNTICNATTKRQQAAKKLAAEVDAMLVVGGKNSANTSRLAQICRETNKKTYHIETADEIEKSWLENVSVIGVTAGASTPQWLLRNVIIHLEKY